MSLSAGVLAGPLPPYRWYQHIHLFQLSLNEASLLRGVAGPTEPKAKSFDKLSLSTRAGCNLSPTS